MDNVQMKEIEQYNHSKIIQTFCELSDKVYILKNPEIRIGNFALDYV